MFFAHRPDDQPASQPCCQGVSVSVYLLTIFCLFPPMKFMQILQLSEPTHFSINPHLLLSDVPTWSGSVLFCAAFSHQRTPPPPHGLRLISKMAALKPCQTGRLILQHRLMFCIHKSVISGNGSMRRCSNVSLTTGQSDKDD